MRYSPFLTITGIAATSVGAFGLNKTTASPAQACDFFRHSYPNQTYFPNTTEYNTENEESWSASAWLSPACIFAPSSAEEVSCAVTTLTRLNTLFAIRGGGHMPIDNAANINSSGVLLTSSKLTSLKLSDDEGTVSVAPGNRWGAVYKYLEPFGLTIVGGRMGVVGVPGFLLGGGISFFSYEHGFASSNGNIRAFECVLANGSIVEATATNQYSDLFWALKGGGNSFCIVTRFDLKTFVVPSVYVGEASYGPGVADQWIDSVYNFALYGSSDPKAAVTPVARWGSSLTAPTYDATMFYSGNHSSPAVLKNFTAPVLTPQETTYAHRSMYNYTQETDAPFASGQGYGFRQRFFVVSLRASKEAITMIHDTYFSTVQTQLANVTNFFAGLAFMPITHQYIAAGNAAGGNPQGISESRGPYIWVEQSYMWSDAADDDKINNFLTSINANITTWLDSRDLGSKYLYLNDADAIQPVFQGYPAENLRRLKDIRNKYDPGMVYTKMMPGGWKVEDA
ncbi:MAG: hypothetical protein M1834_002420 [Cirrosporium novae-zelandiae]|nr:MAG: hypothetical protein M1834_002420 [Cirrosporium novae-zelandiae]